MPYARVRAWGAVVWMSALLLAAGAAGALAGTQPILHARVGALRARERDVLYSLYAQDSALARARAEIAALDRRRALLRRRTATARDEVKTARRVVSKTRRVLARQLVWWYKGNQPDTIEIVLGAGSLDSALTQLDLLHRATRYEAGVIAEATRARRELDASLTRLAEATAGARLARQQLAGQVSALEISRASKRAYLDSLRRERRRDVVLLDAAATAAARRSQRLKAPPRGTPRPGAATVPPAPAAPAPSVAATAPSVAPGARLTVSATAYSLPGSTASGLPVGPGVCAVDPSVIPMGTRFDVPGYGTCIAADTGSAVVGATIDLWVADPAAAAAWGHQTVTITFR